MNFGELLHTAKKNEQSKNQIQYYSTKFTAPKKEQKAKTVSINVQKFLQRKEAEEKQKRIEAEERKTNLLALRSQDKKATRRVNVMLKRTKSANQSVIADALDSDNTAVTLAGPSQPDEDDYGYVSQESSALYNKMMEKYNKMPDEPKFPEFRKKVSTNLSSTKDRVKAALEKEKEDALLPHRRKRKRTSDSAEDSEKSVETVEYEPEPERKEPPKPKFKAAPPVNFSDLLKLAEKKQFEPVVIETKKEEEERPLTKKQKKEMEREKEWRERKESRNKMPPPDKPAPSSNRIPKVNGSAPQTIERIPKKTPSNDNQEFKKPQRPKDPIANNQNVNKSQERTTNPLPKNSSNNNNNNVPGKSARPENRQLSSKPELNKKSEVHPQQRPLNGMKTNSARHDERPRTDPKRDGQKPRPNALEERARMASSSKDLPKKNSLPEARKMPVQQNEFKNKQMPSNAIRPKQFPPNDLKPKQFPPSDLKPKQFPPSDLKPKQNPTSDLRKKFPPKDVKRKAMLNKRRILDDDDDEYDSEMDDFIDDGPEECEDYSNVISQIFGYDRRKYQVDDDDDVDDMETNFAQQMKEEVISTKIGIMEDLEDMRQEEEAKKKKMMMKKRGKL